MIHSQLHKGESYGKLVPVYVVCFMNFRLQHDTDKLIYTYQLRETTGEGYTKRSLLNLYLCELPRFAGEPGKASDPVEEWFDILQNMSTFVSRTERYIGKYDAIFECSRQYPIPEQDKLQYFRSIFNDDIRSYFTDEDRKGYSGSTLTKPSFSADKRRLSILNRGPLLLAYYIDCIVGHKGRLPRICKLHMHGN